MPSLLTLSSFPPPAERVITGCALFAGERWVSGDLFDAGNVYLFNANVRPQTCEPDWQTQDVFYLRQLHPSDWWEKRGIFVIRKEAANLNQLALDYIRGGA